MIDPSKLNTQQQEAVLHGPGPCLVLATAGSGKTRVLTMRAARLIDDGIAKPERVLLATFTKKAAEEMKARLAVMVGEERASRMWIGTVHGTCYKILKTTLAELGEHPVELLTGGRQILFARDILAESSPKHPNGMGWKTDPKRLLGLISRAKADLIDVRQAEKYFSDHTTVEEVRLHFRFWQLYEANKAEKHLVDFDDLLLRVYQLFTTRCGVLERWQNCWDYILEDEVQDTMIAQHQVVKMLAAKHRNYFAVGDANQAVYGFRGSDPEYTIMSFQRDYLSGKIIKLPTNYRSASTIVELGSRIIRHNSLAAAYTLDPQSARLGGMVPELFVSRHEDDEAEQVVKRILRNVRGGQMLRHIAVLYRTNAQSRAFEDAMITRDIPYVVYGSCGFYDRKEVKDLLAYLQLAYGPNCAAGDEALKRVINIPSSWMGQATRYLGRAFVHELESIAHRNKVSLYEALELGYWKEWQWKAIQDLIDLVDTIRLAGPEPVNMLRKAREACYDAFLAASASEDDADEVDGSKSEVLDELVHKAETFDNAAAMLLFVAQQRNKAKKLKANQDAVQLLTIHRSKGLEWPVVYLAGVSLGLLPHKKSVKYHDPETRRHIKPDSIMEERRLCYVGVTRAMNELYVSALCWYGDDQLDFSPFLVEGGFKKPVEFMNRQECIVGGVEEYL